jgi:hypothetical protein
MDLFTTSLILAGVKPPQDRIIDGIELSSILFNQTGSVMTGRSGTTGAVQ